MIAARDEPNHSFCMMIATIAIFNFMYFGLNETPSLFRSAHIALLFMTEFFSAASAAGAGKAAAS